MSMNGVDLDYVARFAGFGDDMPHDVLDGIVLSVEAMLTNAGVKRHEGEDPLYDHCVADLAALYHDNRGNIDGHLSPAQYAMIVALRSRPAEGTA